MMMMLMMMMTVYGLKYHININNNDDLIKNSCQCKYMWL